VENLVRLGRLSEPPALQRSLLHPRPLVLVDQLTTLFEHASVSLLTYTNSGEFHSLDRSRTGYYDKVD
jgi:hypothetical protein